MRKKILVIDDEPEGRRLIRRILEKLEHAVIMVTGDGDLDRVKLAMERGAREYVTKPFDLQSLETSITSNLERRSARQAAAPSKRAGKHA